MCIHCNCLKFSGISKTIIMNAFNMSYRLKYMICHLTYLKFELTYEKSLLISGGSDGLLVLWTAENSESREISPKQTIKVFFNEMHISSFWWWKTIFLSFIPYAYLNIIWLWWLNRVPKTEKSYVNTEGSWWRCLCYWASQGSWRGSTTYHNRCR